MRMFCVLFCFCFLLVGCGNEKTDKNVIEINEKILNKNFEFYSTEYKTTMMVTEYLELLEDTFQNDSSYYRGNLLFLGFETFRLNSRKHSASCHRVRYDVSQRSWEADGSWISSALHLFT